MKNILSLILSFVLFLQPLAFAQSAYKRGTSVDTSFFSIPRLPEQAVQEQCNTIFKTKKRICSQHYKYGITRAQAWQAYQAASDPWAREGAYWKMSPAEIYNKYEEVSKDIANLWNINPEYKAKKREDISNKILTGLIITMIAYEVGVVMAPILEGMGFSMSAQIAALTPFKARGIVSPLKFAIQSVRTRFWADLGITMAYMAMDGIFVESAYSVLNDLTQELQESIQEHVNTGYAVDTRNLLLEIVAPKLTKEEQKELENNKDEIYNLDQELKEKLKSALQEQGWGDDPMVKREAVVTLYALEYLRAEMADMSDFFRYREAAIDLAQIYFSGNLTDLHEDRYEVYALAKEAYKTRKDIRKKQSEEIVNRVITTAFVD